MTTTNAHKGYCTDYAYSMALENVEAAGIVTVYLPTGGLTDEAHELAVQWAAGYVADGIVECICD